jgi:hypothetical protein
MGLGYTASLTRVGATMRGLDGNMWEVQSYRSGKYRKRRWIPTDYDRHHH